MMLICPVRPGDSNEELRYALRSWETNLVIAGGIDLTTVGYKPSWLEPDHHIEGNHYASAPVSIWDNVMLGSEYAATWRQDVLFMNDDFFCMDPMSSVPVYKRNISLADHIALSPLGGGGWWADSLRLTASWLSEAGFPHPASYETHRPLLASPRGMFSALSQWDRGYEGGLPQWRTVYGVLNKVEAHPVGDVKLGLRGALDHSPWVSTSDQSWRRYGRNIAARFQKPSRWER